LVFNANFSNISAISWHLFLTRQQVIHEQQMIISLVIKK
jgi:hypothetical protein